MINIIKSLRKPVTEPFTQLIYNDRARVIVMKSPYPGRRNNRHKYSYHVFAEFIYNGEAMDTIKRFDGLQKALNYAEETFVARNNYMIDHDYRLPNEGSSI